jgi:hypothetical protein
VKESHPWSDEEVRDRLVVVDFCAKEHRANEEGRKMDGKKVSHF